MTGTDKAEDLKADLILLALKRRERLLKTVQGQSEWKVWTSVIISSAIVIALTLGQQDTMAPIVLMSMVTGFAGAYLTTSRRLDALIELIGKEHLLKPEKIHEDA